MGEKKETTLELAQQALRDGDYPRVQVVAMVAIAEFLEKLTLERYYGSDVLEVLADHRVDEYKARAIAIDLCSQFELRKK